MLDPQFPLHKDNLNLAIVCLQVMEREGSSKRIMRDQQRLSIEPICNGLTILHMRRFYLPAIHVPDLPIPIVSPDTPHTRRQRQQQQQQQLIRTFHRI